MNTARAAPAKAAHVFTMSGAAGNRIADSATKKPAPALIPRRPASDRGFLVIPCITAPERAKAIPVSPAASAAMLAILRQQHYNTMLTHDFPQYYLDCEETGAQELIWVASKSGSMNACRNDGGIVHTPYGEYVIVLMNRDFHDIIEYNEHPAMVYGARVSRMILDQILACEGKLYLD